MSVYTHLSDDQFAAFCYAFGIEFANAIPITQGIKNSNWFIQTQDDAADDHAYVFTLFEERTPDDIEKMAVILNQLKDKLPVAAPLAKTRKAADGSDDYLIHYENKAITLVPCLSGQHPTQITRHMCWQMGEALARLHQSLASLSPAEDYGVPLYPWHEVRDREMGYMPGDEAKLMRDIWQAYEALPQDELPSGLCHLDMFADNTLWDLSAGKETLTGLLDFTEVSVEHYVMDIAITINDFCTTWGDAEHGESVSFDRQKMLAFLQGYESVRALTDTERQALPVMLAKAAVIFWLLRLNVMHYNRLGGRTGDNIMVKNPDLMKRLAAYHWQHIEADKQLTEVYLLKYVAHRGTDQQEVKLVGIFSSQQLAKVAIAKLSRDPKYRDHADGFIINQYPLDSY